MARTKLTSLQRSLGSLCHLGETSKQSCVPLAHNPFDLLLPIPSCQRSIAAASNARELCNAHQSRDALDAGNESSCLPTSSHGRTFAGDFLQRDGSCFTHLPSSSSSSSSFRSALLRAFPSCKSKSFGSRHIHLTLPQTLGSRHVHLTPDNSRDTGASSGEELQHRTVADDLLSLQTDLRVVRPLYRSLLHAVRSLRAEFERFGTNSLLSPGDIGWLYDNAPGSLNIIKSGDVTELENYLRERFCDSLPSSSYGDYVSMQLELGRRLDKGFRALALVSRRLSLLQLHTAEPSSECLTDGIRVLTQCWFNSRTDARLGAIFHYKIIIRNESHPEPVQLVSRAWNITDFEGEVNSVIGPGVIGMYPILSPGEQYEYTSFSGLKSKRGTQHGTFTMIGMDSKRVFEVKIAPFALIP